MSLVKMRGHFYKLLSNEVYTTKIIDDKYLYKENIWLHLLNINLIIIQVININFEIC